ncbi:3-coathanger stack domain-containing protein [Winogradskyella sp.]|uniref:3-coathanger stack domain-containing protein n=1 Tax=Winogradskyella sp. TaxID=1883156 RepID=UPI002639B312|nr:3-coathanger stack domain-containing protein [Winogradskyella sp.]
MKINIHKIVTLVLIFPLLSNAQLENANWYFGDNVISSQNGGGLNFNNGTVSVLTDGKTEDAFSSTATVSDENGNLLFYTDGSSVWNKNHNKMSGGNNSLNGFYTVSVVPFPGDSDKYYIFTIGSDGTFNLDYFYSIVDMSLNNGLGNVDTNSLNTNLNILPYTSFNPDGSFDIKGEMQRKSNIVVAKHSDGESYWLILNPFDVFFVLKIDSNGISSNPIIYDEGNPSLDYNLNIRGASGMSISPNNDKISYYCNRANGGNQSNLFTILNFNNSSGQLSPSFFTVDNPNFAMPGYASEFSGNGNYLYLLVGGGFSYEIFQFDLQNTNINPVSIGLSLPLPLSDNPETDLPTMVRGIDGKIYVPNNNNFLGVINNPNLFGTNSNYVNNQIDLGTNVIAKKLPQQVQNQINNNCPDNLTITQTVSNGTNDIQEASNWIVALNVIENAANAEYDAGNFVKLQRGFHARAGSTFRAYIDGCLNTQPVAKNSIFNNDKISDNQIVIFPNPAKDKVRLSHNQMNIQSFELYDIHGRTVINNNNLNSSKHTIDVSSFEKGFYIIRIVLEDNSVITKNLVIK